MNNGSTLLGWERLAYDCDGDARQQIRISLLRDQSTVGMAWAKP